MVLSSPGMQYLVTFFPLASFMRWEYTVKHVNFSVIFCLRRFKSSKYHGRTHFAHLPQFSSVVFIEDEILDGKVLNILSTSLLTNASESGFLSFFGRCCSNASTTQLPMIVRRMKYLNEIYFIFI